MINMAFTSLNLIRELLETSLFGNTWLVGLFVVFFFVVILLVCRVYPEVALLIPLPIFVALAEAGIIPFFIKPLIYIMAGVYLSVVILIITGMMRK